MDAVMGEEKNESGVVEQQQHDDQMGIDMSSNEDGKFEVYSINYPERIGADLEKAWPKVKSAIENYGLSLSCTLNLVEGSMTVFTTRKNTDQKWFRRARMLIGLLANHVPPHAALSILSKRLEIIDIGTGAGGICSNIEITEEQFLARSKFLSPTTLEALAQWSGCDLLFRQRDQIFATGSDEELKLARKIVEGCMLRQICPKSLVMKRESIKSMNQAINELGELHF